MYVRKSRKSRTYNREKLYSVYKGDNFIMTGSWYEVMERLNITPSTLKYYLSKSYLKRIKKKNNKRLIIEPIGEFKNGDVIYYEDNY